MRAYILAGGLGTRLYPYSLILPKPLLTLGSKTIIEHILDWLTSYNFEEIIIAISGRKWAYDLVLKDSYKGTKLKINCSEKPLGTAGQLKWVAKDEHDTFFVSYSDSLIEANIDEVIKTHKKNSAMATVLTAKIKEKLRYGVIEEKKGLIKEWKEKPELHYRVAAGAFVFEPEFLKYIPDQKYGMNNAVMNAIKAKEKVLIYDVKSFVDVGNLSYYRKAAFEFAEKFGEIP
ncbi:MAG: sugar phosphate nucleotidyltransferase [Nitrososphaeria archaeon]|jgi:mannose-1-phosphate guanylyltransferase